MSDYLKKPILTKKIQTNKGQGFTATTCEMQGWRRTMEDSSVFQKMDKNTYLLGVFDGHGGPEVAHYAAQMLPKQLLNEPYFKLHNYPKAFSNVFHRIDELLQSQRGQEHLKTISLRLNCEKGYSNEKISYRAGTTAVTVLITKDKYYIANIGDSRAVLSRGGQAVKMSTDHKPDLNEERTRIERAGGFVQQGRVNGTLSLSRAFGDFEYKRGKKCRWEEEAVCSVPEVIEMDRQPEDEFILIGCDGVWERHVANSQKMVDLVRQLRNKHENSKVVMDKLFGELVAKDAKQMVGGDNMTAILIQFSSQ